jgi:hypothetical protein
VPYQADIQPAETGFKQYPRQSHHENASDFRYTDSQTWVRMRFMKTKPIFPAMAVSGVIALSLLAPDLSPAQTGSSGQAGTDSKALGALIQEVQAQQKTIADNQVKIDEKLAAIAENLRQARIYISRGGR